MFVEPDADALIAALAAAIAGRLLPDAEGDARYYAEAALNMIARHQLASGAHRQALLATREGEPVDDRIMLEREATLADGIEADVTAAVARLKGRTGTFLPPPDPSALAAYFAQAGWPGASVRDIRPIVGGNSKQTIMFDLVLPDGAAEQLVMRRDHPNCYADTCVIDEFPVIRALFADGFPVPEPLLVEASSPIVLGRFLISRRAPGHGIGDYFALADDEGVDPIVTLAGIMARLHAIDVNRLGDPALAAAAFDDRCLADRIAYWRGRYAVVANAPLRSMRVAFDWLDANRGVGLEDPVVVHGDPGCHNLLVDGEAVSAVIDWEFGHVGARAEDLNYCLGYVEMVGEVDRFLAAYGDAGGRIPSRAAMDYYHVYRLVRSLTLFAAATRYFNEGDNDDVAVMQAIATLTSSHVGMLAAAMLRLAPDAAAHHPGAVHAA